MSQHENHYQCKVDNVIQYETKINLKLQSNNFHMYSAQVEPSKFNNHLKKKTKTRKPEYSFTTWSAEEIQITCRYFKAHPQYPAQIEAK